MHARTTAWAREDVRAQFAAAEKRDRKRREKAKLAMASRAKRVPPNPFDPIPSALNPVARFAVDTGQDWCQRFACLPDCRGGLELVVVSKRGFRSVGQWSFKTWQSAERWAAQQVRCNGPFDVY